MTRPIPDEVRREKFLHACLSSGIPRAEAEAMLAAHDALSPPASEGAAAGCATRRAPDVAGRAELSSGG